MTDNDLAQALFIAYNEWGPRPWLTFDDRPVPAWNDLTESVRAKWRAVARRASELAPSGEWREE